MLYVEHLQHVDAATWDDLLIKSPGGGHALQTYAWGEVKSTQGWTPLRLALKDGDSVLGVGQVLVRRPPGVPMAVAYCPKGPWINWASAEHVRAMVEGMEQIARRNGAVVLKIESELLFGPGLPDRIPPSVEAPLHRAIVMARRLRRVRLDLRGPGAIEPNGKMEQDGRIAEARIGILAAREAQAADGQTPGRRVLAERGFVKSRWDLQFRTTMVVDLDRPPDAMLARMKSKWRYNVNLAERKGVRVEQNDGSAARHLLYDMYRRTAERDGFLLRSRSYFERAWETMIGAGHAHIFLASHGGRPLAAMLLFVLGRKAWYQIGASETEGRNLMPAHALQFCVMQWAQQRGITYYDMVAIPNLENLSVDDPMWGLYVFKSGFGGRPVEWAGCFDKVLDPRGHAWEAFEPAYYRLYNWRVKDVMY